jgi:Bacteriophage HK97-gp10, putative tail-component
MAGRKAIRIRGLEEVRQNLRRFGRQVERIVTEALREEAEEIMAAAKAQTPVDTGALRSTGRVQAVERRPVGRLVAVLSFGGPAGAEVGGKFVGYAIYVHENLAAHHAVGNAKFLERPARAAAVGMAGRIALRIRAAGFAA